MVTSWLITDAGNFESMAPDVMMDPIQPDADWSTNYCTVTHPPFPAVAPSHFSAVTPSPIKPSAHSPKPFQEPVFQYRFDIRR